MASAGISGRAWTGAEEVSRVVRKRHPTFSFWRLPVLLVLLIFCCRGAGAALDPAKGYRLAGTLAVGQSYIAFLEMPDGGQVLVRAGSEVAGARVLEVTAKGLRLRLAAGVVELSLDGTGKAQVAPPSAAVSSAADDDKHRVYTRNVSEEHLARELTAKAGPGVAKPSGSPQLVAAQRIAAVLDLPKDSTVVRVEGQAVSSADQAISELQSAFASSAGVVTLDVKTPAGPGRVYLMSERN
jgi:hypothetical protein